MNKMDEMIIVAPRKSIFQNEELSFQGVLIDKNIIDSVIENLKKSHFILRRGDAEINPNYKQPIPYAIIQRENEVFVYERLAGAGELRLHNKLSLGIGGHMNPIPDEKDFDGLIIENLLREINEEIDIDEGTLDLELAGLINDDGDDVGKVHLGILAIINIGKNQSVRVLEKNELSGRFIPLKDLKQEKIYERLESWSKIVVDILVTQD